MSDPTWPVTLPKLDYPNAQQGYAVTPDAGVVSFDTEIGPPKDRRRNTADWETLSFTIVCSNAQLATLKSFWRDSCKKVLPFTKVNPEDHDAGSPSRFRFHNKTPLKYTALGGDSWSVDVMLMRVP